MVPGSSFIGSKFGGCHSAGTSEEQFGTAPPVDDDLVKFPSVRREVVQQSFGRIALDSEPQKAGRSVDDLVLVVSFAAHKPFTRHGVHDDLKIAQRKSFRPSLKKGPKLFIEYTIL